MPPLGRKARLWSLFWASVALVAGATMTKTMVFDWPQYRASQAWPTAAGIITAVALDSVRNARGTINYFPNISYRYRVGDSTFHGARLQLGSPYFPTYADGELALRPFSDGGPAVVHYDPSSPEVSVLQLRLLTWSDRLLVPMALVAVGIGLYSAWEGITGRTPRLPWRSGDDPA